MGCVFLTPPMVRRLQYVRDLGPNAWDHGAGRAGGAISRMFARMKDAGLVTGPPYEVTEKARKALSEIEIKRITQRGTHGQDTSQKDQ